MVLLFTITVSPFSAKVIVSSTLTTILVGGTKE